MYFASAILGFAVPQTSQIGARGCRCVREKHANNYK